MKDRLIVIAATFSPELAHQARVAAAQENISRSALIRHAVVEHLARLESGKKLKGANKGRGGEQCKV